MTRDELVRVALDAPVTSMASARARLFPSCAAMARSRSCSVTAAPRWDIRFTQAHDTKLALWATFYRRRHCRQGCRLLL